MKRFVSQQFTEEMRTRFVTRRAMQTLFADETGAATGQAVSTLNMQLNSFAILPKEERKMLDLYATAPPRPEAKKERSGPQIGRKRLRIVNVERDKSKVDILV